MVIWLVAALQDDTTGGQVDGLACFVAPGVVVATSYEDRRAWMVGHPRPPV